MNETSHGICLGRSRGISLMEVILALAILAGAMAAIGELTRIGVGHATAARDLSRGHIYCQSILAQVDAGVLPASPSQGTALDVDPEWTYSLDVQTLPTPGLLAVTVSTQRRDDASSRPLRATLVQWIVDPDYLEQLRQEEAAQAAEQEAAESQDTGADDEAL